MELSSRKLKKILYFLKKNSCISGRNLQSLKNKNLLHSSKKVLLTFWDDC